MMVWFILATSVCAVLRYEVEAYGAAPTVTRLIVLSRRYDIINSSFPYPSTLLCRARGRPPLTFTIYKNGQKLESRTAALLRTQLFKISDGRKAVHGTFECVVDNIRGRDSKQLRLGKPEVQKQDKEKSLKGNPPVITRVRALRYTPRMRNHTNTTSIFILCKATGTFPLNFTWYKDNIVVKTESKKHWGSSSLLATTGGPYSCKVTNDNGDDAKEITVIYRDFNFTRRFNDIRKKCKEINKRHIHDIRLKFFPFVAAASGFLFIIVVGLVAVVVFQHRKIRQLRTSNASLIEPPGKSAKRHPGRDTNTELNEMDESQEHPPIAPGDSYEEVLFRQADLERNEAADVQRDASSREGHTLSGHDNARHNVHNNVLHNVRGNDHQNLRVKKAIRRDTSEGKSSTSDNYDYAYKRAFFLSSEANDAINDEITTKNKAEKGRRLHRELECEQNYNYAYEHASHSHRTATTTPEYIDTEATFYPGSNSVTPCLNSSGQRKKNADYYEIM